MRSASVLLAVVLLLAGVTAAAAEEPKGLSAAKATFEKVCATCHGIDRPLGLTKDRAGWEATIKRMAQKTPIPAADQAAVVDYLAAKDLFQSTCSKCHGTDRPLGLTKDRGGWEATVKRMAAKAGIPEATQKTIIDYLTAVRGK